MTLPQGDVLVSLWDQPLDPLFPPETLDRLHALGIWRIGDFVRLPHVGVVRYAGVEASRLHRALHDLGTGDGHHWRRVYRAHPRLRLLLGNPQDREADRWLWWQRDPDVPLTTTAQFLPIVRPLLQQCETALATHQQSAVEVGLRLVGDSHAETVSTWPKLPPARADELAAVVLRLLEQVIQAQEVPPEICTIAVGIRPGSTPPGRQLRLLGKGAQARQDTADLERILRAVRQQWGERAILLGGGHELHTHRRLLDVQAQCGPYAIEPQRLFWHGQWQSITVLNRWRYKTRWWRGPDATITVEYFQVLTARSDPLWIVFNHQQHCWSLVKGAGFPGFYDDRLR